MVQPQTLCLLSLMVRLHGLVNLSKHIKGSKECCLLGQNTTCEFSVLSLLSTNQGTK